MSFEIEGIDELIKKLESVGKDVDGAIKSGLNVGARKVKTQAKLLAPVALKQGGTLRGSIQFTMPTPDVNTNQIASLVYSNLEYAPYVEYGTGQRGAGSPIEDPPEGLAFKTEWAGMKAQPYLYPALKLNKDNIEQAVESALRKLLGGK